MQENNTPTNLVIFGFSGDLAKRKVIPALLHLNNDGYLGKDLEIIGVVRRDIEKEEVMQNVREHIRDCNQECQDKTIPDFIERIKLIKVDLENTDDFYKLKDLLSQQDEICQVAHNRIFYFAIPPYIFTSVVNSITATELQKCGEGAMSRLLIEKPFGSNVESAQELINLLDQHFADEQVYRIDHYLAKDTVQNIINFRFDNPIINSVWDPKYIKEIQISALESIDIEGRGSFYESTGALRDMIQSHLLQILAVCTMPEPLEDDFRNLKCQTLKKLQVMSPEEVTINTARGQYHGYREEAEAPDSLIETFAALKVHLNDQDWSRVPIYLRAGKALSEKRTQIDIIYHDPRGEDKDNVLSIKIQPNEEVSVNLIVKKPGLEHAKVPVKMTYEYSAVDDLSHDAYERVLLDVLRGDQSLFPTSEEIINNWKYIEPIINDWHSSDLGLVDYAKGSKGPHSSEELMMRNKTKWLT